ncbi:hypothetical protein CK203_007286 [Vitis vinifera]|uniref:Uncharacterized protein n=1 Tax=Vitis vinifera TaxID=29760 RepID=A0A438G1R6_VITVI|nr:hypothetical protein CK203_007286 [Vitis vinifera]
MSVTVFVTRPRYVVFASLTIVPEFFVDMSSECRRSFTVYDIRSRILSLTFRVVITSQFDVQSHHHHFSVSAFRAIIDFRSTFRVISSVSAFRVVITSQFDVQSHHHHFLVSTFRAIIDFQIDIQSHILEPSSTFRLTFRVISSVSAFGVVITSQFDVQKSLSLLSLTFRVIIITSQFRRSELSSIFRLIFRVPSSVSAFRVVITSQFDVQSHHHHFLVSAFRAIIGFQIDIQSPLLESPPQFRRSESLSLLSLTFRVIIITSQFRRSELSSIFRSTFRVISSASAFGVVITSQFDVQSRHHHFSVSAFRAIIGFQIDIQSRILGFGVQSRYHFLSLTFRSFYFLSSVSRVGLVIQGHNSWRSYPLALRILPSGSCIRPRFSSLRYPVLIAYSSRTLGWFEPLLIFDMVFRVIFGDILERA